MRIKQQITKNLGGWLLMLPGIALFALFVWIPLFSNVSLSFYETVGFTKENFVLFRMYAKVFTDANFTRALLNTLLYTVWSVVIGFLPPFIMALILSEIRHCKGFFKAMIYLPAIIPGIATFILWSFIFDPNPMGALNSIFTTLGLKPSLFVDNPVLTIPLIVLTMTWKGSGATALIYLASVQNVDNNLYEAARLDGAGKWRRLISITVPQLWPLIKMLFVLQIISVFQVFYEPMVMTKGGNQNSLSLMLLNYQYAFKYGEAGKSAALGVIISIIIITFTAIYFRAGKKKGEAV